MFGAWRTRLRVAPALVDAAIQRLRGLDGRPRSAGPVITPAHAAGGAWRDHDPGRVDGGADGGAGAGAEAGAGGLGPEPLRRAHVLAVAVVLVVALVGAIALVVRNRPVSEPIRGPTGPSAPAGMVSTSPPAGTLPPAGSPSVPVVLVHVAGKVRRPGLFRLRPGDRVADAVAAAGGIKPGVDPAVLNLARPVVDGEQIVVGAAAPPMTGSSAGPDPSGGSGAGGATGGMGPGGAAAQAPVDLNTATVADLDGLPGVGPVLAQRILDYRSQRGRFGSVDELREVTGIGDKRFHDLKARVAVR